MTHPLVNDIFAYSNPVLDKSIDIIEDGSVYINPEIHSVLYILNIDFGSVTYRSDYGNIIAVAANGLYVYTGYIGSIIDLKTGAIINLYSKNYSTFQTYFLSTFQTLGRFYREEYFDAVNYIISNYINEII